MRQSLDLSGIRKGFGPLQVLKDIDLSVQQGEFLSLVGMSGCGKSTLLRIIAGLEMPDAGAVRIGGRDVTAADPSDRDLAMVFQSYALYPHMTVRQNIATPLRMRRLPFSGRLPLIGRLAAPRAVLDEIAAEVATAADTLQITHLLDRKPAQLSGGQRQRVALARALVRQPAAFLMDEPLSNLDAKLRAHMRDELVALHRRLGATFVYVTHDQMEAMTMSDRIALMIDGRIEQLGTPEDLYRRPATLAVARFIGSPTINLLAAEVMPTGAVHVHGSATGLIASPGPATLGIRPEGVRIVARGMPARILREETHGPDRYLTCLLSNGDGDQLTLRQPAGEATGADAEGRLHLAIDGAQAHLFGPDGARRALRTAEQVAA
ncbi:ABC transporter ATP-binding protein [Falsirhodobacter algicola]|uniref:ATP-binding cassette domain-containing protein n=1 Tax=Falsirhodobacter algicola TaxID=2692330 RepID=A0A8J8SLA6_9RHOB|nr:ABC transporter ATP-binding protein [Falsirhodobacter algicola]QUS36224.1 ATP-binding cassette domain-containing protein [Falsirhodobacter algicola]